MSIKQDRIVAEATPHGRGGVSIIRFSGPSVLDFLGRLVRFRSAEAGAKPAPRTAYLVDVLARGEVVDEALVLWFPGPKSFTGEDVVELHLHGNPAIVRLVLEETMLCGFRRAEAGEFTQRAFANGRLDLTQVDALAGLLEAERADFLSVAARQLGGALRRRLLELREQVLSALAGLELGLDFAEEGYDFVGGEELVSIVLEIDGLVSEMRRAYRSQCAARSIPMVALVGEPNAGKSTLFNAILGYERSITHAEPGTTRDYVSEVVDVGSARFRLVDTAGLRETSDVIEAEGVARVHEVIREADLVIAVVDGTRLDAQGVARGHARFIDDSHRLLTLFTHADSPSFPDVSALSVGGDVASYSSHSAADVASLIKLLAERLAKVGSETSASVFLVSERQEEILADAEGLLRTPSLDSLREGDVENVDVVLVSSDLRRLLRLFSDLIGEATNEDVLDRVFSQFCIGK